MRVRKRPFDLAGLFVRSPLLLGGWLCAGCDGGTVPLSVEVREAAGSGNADKVEVFVKSAPGVDLTVDGRTENTGTLPNRSFLVPKSRLKLGANTLTVGATRSSLGSRSTATASAKIDLSPRNVLHVKGDDGAPHEASFLCPGAMCAAPSIAFAKSGKMQLSVVSDVSAKLTLEGKSVALAAGVKTPVDVDLVAKLGQTPVTRNEDAAFPATLEADGATLTEPLILRGPGMNELAARELAKAASGPVRFPGEPEPAPAKPPEAMVVTGAPSGPLIVIGGAKTFADVDLVGVGTASERRFPCPSGAVLVYVDLDVKVVNRRTGAVVGQRTLSADRTTCPPTPTAQPLKSAVREDDTRKVMTEAFLKR